MSTVDYTIPVRRRPEWRRVRLQPGLWLAWAVMIAALLMAIAPQWFTSSNPLEDPGAQRRAAGALLAGTDQLGRDLWTRVVYGAVHSLSAALIAVAIGGGGYRPWHPRRGAGRTRGIHHHAPVDVLLAILPAAAAHGDYSAGFRHGKCGGGGWRRGYRQLRAGASRSGTRAPQRLRRGGPGSGGTFSPSSGAIFCPTRSLRCLLSRRCSSVRRCWPRHPQLPRLRHSAAGPGVGTTDRRRSHTCQPPVADHLPGLAVVAVVLAANRLSRQWSGVRP